LSENDVVAASRHFTQARSILTPESYRALIDDPFFAPYASVATLTPFFLQSTLSP